MKVFIASSSSKTIDKKFLNLAYESSEYFAKKGYDLMFGACSYSMMGECYNAFIDNNRTVYAYTVKKYENDLKGLPKAKRYLVEDTLTRFKELYFDSDVILILPGGIGTLAELSCALEEYRASLGDKKIIIYNFNGYYDDIIDWMESNIETGFISESLKECYKVVSNINELKKVVEEK